MIVDLLRNDLWRVCTAGSVEVPVLCGLESYASVHHLVSIVTTELAQGQQGVLPRGIHYRGPKVRSTEIICKIGPGQLVLSVLTGTWTGIFQSPQSLCATTWLFFHAASGITALSDPEAEYDETIAKAQRIFDAFYHDNHAAS